MPQLKIIVSKEFTQAKQCVGLHVMIDLIYFCSSNGLQGFNQFIGL